VDGFRAQGSSLVPAYGVNGANGLDRWRRATKRTGNSILGDFNADGVPLPYGDATTPDVREDRNSPVNASAESRSASRPMHHASLQNWKDTASLKVNNHAPYGVCAACSFGLVADGNVNAPVRMRHGG